MLREWVVGEWKSDCESVNDQVILWLSDKQAHGGALLLKRHQTDIFLELNQDKNKLSIEERGFSIMEMDIKKVYFENKNSLQQ